MRMKLALGIYLVGGVVNVVLGTMYFFSNQFMSYHAQAVGASWQELDPGVRTVILALMKLAGGGWCAIGVLTIVLALAAFKSSSVVTRWVLPMGTVIFYLGSLTATWGVYRATGAPAPWGSSLAMIMLALAALVIDSPWSLRVRETE